MKESTSTGLKMCKIFKMIFGQVLVFKIKRTIQKYHVPENFNTKGAMKSISIPFHFNILPLPHAMTSVTSSRTNLALKNLKSIRSSSLESFTHCLAVKKCPRWDVFHLNLHPIQGEFNYFHIVSPRIYLLLLAGQLSKRTHRILNSERDFVGD